MAVKMRLRREGKRKQPFYRVVVADVRSPRDGRFIDDLGYYQPLRDPSEISIDHERALYWLRNGVQPSDAVLQLLRIEGIWDEFKPGDHGKARSARHQAEAKAARDSAAQEVPRQKAGAAQDRTPAQHLAVQEEPEPVQQAGATAADETGSAETGAEDAGGAAESSREDASTEDAAAEETAS